MDCKECSNKINLKWGHAIKANQCPFCGAQILEEENKELLGKVIQVMDDLAQLPDIFDELLYEKYNLINTESELFKALLKEKVEMAQSVIRDENGNLIVPNLAKRANNKFLDQKMLDSQQRAKMLLEQSKNGSSMGVKNISPEIASFITETDDDNIEYSDLDKDVDTELSGKEIEALANKMKSMNRAGNKGSAPKVKIKSVGEPSVKRARD